MIEHFTNNHYQRHNRRRQEHLASLGLPIDGRSVLEVGAGLGDHTDFFLDRGCTVTATDGREELVEALGSRYPEVRTLVYDANGPAPSSIGPHEIVYAYGTLYHLNEPEHALRNFSALSSSLLLLETCVSFGEDEAVNLTSENGSDFTQAVNGTGCRPTRRWVWNRLCDHFEYVYVPVTQPCHEEFPLDWTKPSSSTGLVRSVFVASRAPLHSNRLAATLLARQTRA